MTSDALAANTTGYILGANVPGAVIGAILPKADDATLNKYDEEPAWGWLPGVGAYRTARRLKATVKNDHPTATVGGETLGMSTSLLASALIGGGLGGAVGGLAGAGVGGLIGLGAGAYAQGIGAVIGAARRKRTFKQQEQADKEDSVITPYLIPGVAGYRLARRMAATNKDEDRRTEEAFKTKE